MGAGWFGDPCPAFAEVCAGMVSTMAPHPSFSLVRTPLANAPRRVIVESVEDLTPTYRRVRLSGDFASFDSAGADDHLRIFFVPADAAIEAPEQLREYPSREYTPVAWTPDSLALDFVVHGTGPASDWAAKAEAGIGAMIGGPRGSLVIEGRPDWWLLAGDRTALPAIRRFLAQVAPGVPVDVIVVAEDAGEEQELDSAGELGVTWVRSLEELVAALDGVPIRDGDGFAFVAAEQSVVKPGRDYLQRRGIEIARAVVKGYWRSGLTADDPKTPQ